MSAGAAQQPVADEVSCVFVPLREQTLLIPNACVAEVVPWRRTKKLTGVPPWCVGVLGWRGESVVVLDFETVLDADDRPQGHRAMLIVRKAQDWEGSAFYALATAGLPRLMALGEAELSSAAEDDDAAIDLRVSVGAESVIIPKLSYLESQVRQIL